MAEESCTATTKQLKRALAALDTAIQNWYKEHVPYYSERYAHCHFRTYPDGKHISNITLKISASGNYINIASSKED
ncbi:MAG: hypothetical protein UIM53_03775 [Acutalibacteraceae bacterium]|nr:hypothetical protein [Acutalibacteraceae bacterium]